MFRSLPFQDMKKIRNINEFIDIFMGKAGINAIVNRRENRRPLNMNVTQSDEIGASTSSHQSELAEVDVHNESIIDNPANVNTSSVNYDSSDESVDSISIHQSKLVKVDVHNESKIVNPTIATTYLILPGGHYRPIPRPTNIFYLGHLVSGISKLPDQMEFELFHFGSEDVIVDRNYVLNLVKNARFRAYGDVDQKNESNCSSASSSISTASIQTVVEIQKQNSNNSVMDWIEIAEKMKAERLKPKSQQQTQTQSSGSKPSAASESEMMESKLKMHQRIQMRETLRALSNIN